jgi:hypothetical protein
MPVPVGITLEEMMIGLRCAHYLEDASRLGGLISLKSAGSVAVSALWNCVHS